MLQIKMGFSSIYRITEFLNRRDLQKEISQKRRQLCVTHSSESFVPLIFRLDEALLYHFTNERLKAQVRQVIPPRSSNA